MLTLTFLFINLVLAGGRPLEIVSDLSMGDLRSRKILYAEAEGFENLFSGHVLEYVNVTPQMKPISNLGEFFRAPILEPIK